MAAYPDFQATARAFGPAAVQAFLREMDRAAVRPLTADPQSACPEATDWSLLGDAMMRHYRLWNGQGQGLDRQSGCHHLAHIAAVAMRLWMLEKAATGTDNRPGTRAIPLLQQLAESDPASG